MTSKTFSTPKEHAISLRNEFRIFTGVGKDADGEPINNYAASKHVAKKSAILAVSLLIENIYGIEEIDYWREVIKCLNDLK